METKEKLAQEPAVEKVIVFEQRKKKKSVKVVKRIIIIAVILAVAAATAIALYNLFKPEETTTPTTFSYIGDISETVTGSGVALPRDSAEITTIATGNVLSVYVSEGDIVTAGDLLFTVDSSAVQKDVTAAREALNEAQNSYDSLREYISNLTLRSPAAGQIRDLKVKKGDTISEGTEIASIINSSQMLLTQYFSYAYEGQIKVGQTVSVSIPSTMAKIDGKVTNVEYVKRVTQEGGMLFMVEITMDNPGALTEGMTATAAVNLDDGNTAHPAELGSLEYGEITSLKSKSGGEIVEINIKEYYEVQAGDVVLVLENDSYEKDLGARRDSVDSARDALNKIEETLANYSMTAPISGTITQCSISEGDELTSASTYAMSISDLSAFVIDMQIDELDIAKLAVGMPAEITMNTYEGGMKYFYGTIGSLSMVGKAENGVSFFPGRIDITETEGLMSGYYVDYSITTSDAYGVLLVDSAAVQYTDMGTVVYIKDQGQERPDNYVELSEDQQIEGFFPVLVETGQSGSNTIEIISGLDPDVEIAMLSGGGSNDMGMGGAVYFVG